MFVDTHCHLDIPSLRNNLHELLARADAAGVRRFVVPGISPHDWDGIITMAGNNRRIFAAPGIHPFAADKCSAASLHQLELLSVFSSAIGEIGLDYTCPVSREVQQQAFRTQLRLAIRLNLPVIIHCRRAFADLLSLLKEEPINSVGGVMHAFCGSPEIAVECIKLGLYIGVAGAITRGNALRPVEVVRRIPLEHLLLETDSPYLVPARYKGFSNEPAFLVETAKVVADIKSISLEQVGVITTINAEKLFRLTPD